MATAEQLFGLRYTHAGCGDDAPAPRVEVPAGLNIETIADLERKALRTGLAARLHAPEYAPVVDSPLHASVQAKLGKKRTRDQADRETSSLIDSRTRDVLDELTSLARATVAQATNSTALTLTSNAQALTTTSSTQTDAFTGEAPVRKSDAAALTVAGQPTGTITVARRALLEQRRPAWHPPWKLMRVISGHLGWVRSITVDPDNRWFATGSGDRTIKIWDLASGTLKLSLTGHISSVRALEASHRHPYLFSAGEDKQVKCWDLETNKVVRHYHGHLSGVYALSLHPQLDVLVTGGRDGVGRVWDMRTRQNVITLSGHRATVSAVKCQEADPQVITGSMDSHVRLWDLAAGKSQATLTHHKKGVRALALHPREFTFASGSADGIRAWKLPEADLLESFDPPDSIVNTLAINQDGVCMAGCDDGTLQLYDWRTGHRYQRLPPTLQPGSLDSEAGIFAATFDNAGVRLITAHADKTIKIYRIDDAATEQTHPLQWTPSLERRRY
ncbi:Pleiotropic regulator 1 [Savitreella phatthalungensis]